MRAHSVTSRSKPSQPDDVPFYAITLTLAFASNSAARSISESSNCASAVPESAISVTLKREKCAVTSGRPLSIAVVTGSRMVLEEGVSIPRNTRGITALFLFVHARFDEIRPKLEPKSEAGQTVRLSALGVYCVFRVRGKWRHTRYARSEPKIAADPAGACRDDGVADAHDHRAAGPRRDGATHRPRRCDAWTVRDRRLRRRHDDDVSRWHAGRPLWQLPHGQRLRRDRALRDRAFDLRRSQRAADRRRRDPRLCLWAGDAGKLRRALAHYAGRIAPAGVFHAPERQPDRSHARFARSAVARGGRPGLRLYRDHDRGPRGDDRIRAVAAHLRSAGARRRLGPVARRAQRALGEPRFAAPRSGVDAVFGAAGRAQHVS